MSCGPGYLRATALGGGIEIAPGADSAGGATVTIRNSALELRRSKVTDNTVRARSPKPIAHGGGICDGQIPDIDQPGQVRLVGSLVARNGPDQCYEC